MSRGCFEAAVKSSIEQSGRDVINGSRFGIGIEVYAKAADVFPEEINLFRITETDAIGVMRRFIWNRIEGDRLPAGLDILMFDTAICFGVAGAISWLQLVVRQTATGTMDNRTLSAVAAFASRYGMDSLIRTYRKQREFQAEHLIADHDKAGLERDKKRSKAVMDLALMWMA